MANKRHEPEEIITKVRQVEVPVGQGKARIDAIREVRITEKTFCRWRKQYGGVTKGHLRRILSSYFDYYHRSRTHLSLEKDCPEPRLVHPADAGDVVAFSRIGGVHHRYERLAV